MTVTIEKPAGQRVSRRQDEVRLARWGRWTFAWLFLLGSVSHFVIALGFRETYRDFAAWSPFGWVQDAWETVFMPNAMILGVLIGGFEVVTGTLILKGKKTMQIGLLAAIAFHLGLVFFGMWPWSVPMIALFILLIRTEHVRQRKLQTSGIHP